MASRREDVLDALRGAQGAMTIAALAEQLDVHPNTVRFHLDALVADGRAEQVSPDEKRPGRPALLYRVAGGMDPGGTRHYRMLAEILTLGLAGQRDASSSARQAGHAWANRMTTPSRTPPSARASINKLTGLLIDLGFSPHPSSSGNKAHIGLRHCPFLELALDNASVVCPIHLGLMQGALSTWKAPVEVDRLEPFVEPGLCLAHLSILESAA